MTVLILGIVAAVVAIAYGVGLYIRDRLGR